MRGRLFAVAAAAFCLLLGLDSASAQTVIRGTEEIDFDRSEAWAMKYFASVSMPVGFGSPESLDAGELDVGLEYSQIPSLTQDERRVGFRGTKVEDLNKVPYLFRPAVRVGLGSKLTVSASYVPPVDRNGAEASIFALALGRPVHEGEKWRLGLRLHSQFGTVEGDFTCSEQTVAAGNNPDRNPFACEAVSEDEYEVRTLGLEVSATWDLGSRGQWEPFVALSYNWMDLEFRVNALYSGLDDRTRLVTDGQTIYTLIGVGYRFGERWRLAGQVFYTPLDIVRPPSTSTQTDELVNVRALISYKIR